MNTKEGVTRCSAGVLVRRGPSRVLAFQRLNDVAGLSLPFGFVDTGECPEEAAVREAREETGHIIRLVEGRPPFVAFDTVGNTMAYTFLGEIEGGDILDMADGEGVARYASIREITRGRFGDYNTRAMRHFGIPVPVVGKFHSHITIDPVNGEEAERAAKLSKGKLTVIALSHDGRSERHYMLTHHFVTGGGGMEDHYDILARLKGIRLQLTESGVPVIRVKLEYEPLHEASPHEDLANVLAGARYVEVHVKCIVPDGAALTALAGLAMEYDWRLSSNPFETRDDGSIVQFVNRRFFGADKALEVVHATVDSFVPFVHHTLPTARLVEVKHEVAVFDDQGQHDAWWAGSSE